MTSPAKAACRSLVSCVNAPDFSNVAAALGKNTDDLTAAITSVFGADAGTLTEMIKASSE